ncbi:hypothetical protein V9L05_16790 [Bernardetia sp. Wsw4-3y2]|uniref:hypothetical protein n=1 Tax=Bernardetia sp. Wsw4-3y2 TaxID=3127471 RepID=UPI0030CD5356
MKKIILALAISIWSFSTFAQTPKGLYFDELNETVWLSSVINSQSDILESKFLGLRLVEIEIDLIQQNTTLWSFGEKLKTKSYNAATKERKIIFECNYEHNKDNRTLKLFLDNKMVEFNYLPVSTGSYVQLTQVKKKK